MHVHFLNSKALLILYPLPIMAFSPTPPNSFISFTQIHHFTLNLGISCYKKPSLPIPSTINLRQGYRPLSHALISPWVSSTDLNAKDSHLSMSPFSSLQPDGRSVNSFVFITLAPGALNVPNNCYW